MIVNSQSSPSGYSRCTTVPTTAVTHRMPMYVQQIGLLLSANRNGVQVPAITRKMFE